MGRRYKTPSRRRLKKWRTRVDRLVSTGIGRKFFRDFQIVEPMIQAARRSGVDLLDHLPKPPPMTPSELHALLYDAFIGPCDWPTRENLEI
jgi:hypothetical protein